MRTLLVISVLAAGCGGSSSTSNALPDSLIIDCVGSWAAKQGTMSFYGNHPDYHPDDGAYWLTGKDSQPLQYAVVGKKLRLWMAYGKQVIETDFKLVTTEDSQHVLKYELRLADAVMGAKVFAGAMAKSYRCEPRKD